MRTHLSLLGGMLALTAIACASLSTAPLTQAVLDAGESPPPSPTMTTRPPSAASTPARLPAGLPLRAEGPWLAFTTAQGLWAVNADGTGLTQLVEAVESDVDIALFGIAPAPRGGLLTVVTVANGFELSGPQLNLVHLPDADIELVADLLPDTADLLTADDWYVVPRTLTYWSLPAWSPDGRALAFAGAMDGPSTDLYVYSPATGQVTRLTSGSTQAVGIEWSPDGEWILHKGAIGTVQSSGPPLIQVDVWAARPDGTQVKRIYELEGSLADPVLGWLDTRTFVTYSTDKLLAPANPPHRLRAVSLQDGTSRVLREAHFTQAAWDPEHKIALVGLESNELEMMLPSETPGNLRLIDASTGAETVVVDEVAPDTLWSPELSLFLVETETGVLAIEPMTGEFTDLAVPKGAVGLPIPSSGGDLAWVGDSLWVGTLTSSPHNPPRLIQSQPTSRAIWAPDGSRLFYYAQRALIVAAAPEFSPAVLAEAVDEPIHWYWVMP